MKIELHLQGMSLQETVIEQHRAMEAVAGLCEDHPDEATWIRAAAALGLENEDIQWSLNQEYKSKLVDPAFLLGLTVLCGGNRELIDGVMLSGGTYQDVILDVADKLVTDIDKAEEDEGLREELRAIREDLAEAQKEFKNTLKKLEDKSPKATAKPKKEDDVIKEGMLQEFKRILGDAHITDASPTYKQLYDQAAEAKKQAESAKSRLSEAEKKAEKSLRECRRLEEEIVHVRRNLRGMTAVPVAEKRRFPWQRKKTEMEEKIVYGSWEEMGTAILQDQTLTEAQVRYLSLLLDDRVLSITEMQEVADARLSVLRMQILASLYYARHGKKAPEDITENVSSDDIRGGKEKAEALAPVPEPVSKHEPIYVDVATNDDAEASGTGGADRLLTISRKLGGKSHVR